ncbi:MAG: outer membrane beta-barrel protein, partial [Halofilum sp. (in: g-proteobacteria)]
MRVLMALAAVLIIAPGAAVAEKTGQYWGLSVDNAKLDDPGDAREGYATNIGFHGGYHFGDFLGAEVQLGGPPAGGIGDPYYAGAFGRFNLPFKQVNVFLLAGAGAVSFDEGAPQGRDTETDLAGGVGVELYGNEQT